MTPDFHHESSSDKGESYVNRHSQAPSTSTAARTGTPRARRTVFGMACLCVLGLAAFLGSGASPAGADSACPNEAIRQSQHAGVLPDCRAWEMVSPPEKAGADIAADATNMTTIAASNGNAITFMARGNFGDTIGSGHVGQTTYLARRDGEEWKTHAITPTSRPDASNFPTATRVRLFSEDLNTAIVYAYDLPGVEGASPLRDNIYVEDTGTGALQAVTTSQVEPLHLTDFWLIRALGLSADAHHIAFETSAKLLPEAEAGVSNLYQWDNGTLSLAGILPDGSAPEGGSVVAPGFSWEANLRWTSSADGSRQLFESPVAGPREVYMRIDASRTVWVSEPEGTNPPELYGAFAQAMTPDGKNVFFVTATQLLPEDTNQGPDLYRYTDGPDPENEPNLTLVSHDGDALHENMQENQGNSVLGTSDDGEVVYWGDQSDQLWVWDHGVNHLIKTGYSRSELSIIKENPGLVGAAPGFSRITPSGSYLAFMQAGEFRAPGQLYLYSLHDDTLQCIACNSGALFTQTIGEPAGAENDPGIRPRYLANDGRVFFSTAEALVPSDTNGILDAYEYDPSSGTSSLLSSGRGSQPSAVVEASSSGDDVFIATRQSLLSRDRDDLIDIYDVRTGGGFVEANRPPALPCSGEQCQPGASTAPPLFGINSTSTGRGNPPHRRQCRHPRRSRPCHRRRHSHQKSTHGQNDKHDRRTSK